jgi:recombination protein RecR
MDSLHRLEEIFSHFPGIGPRQARRFVYHLLNKSSASVKEFVQLVEEIKKSTFECEQCHQFFIADNRPADQTLCSICRDKTRDQKVLMIVARDSDFESIEKSGMYEGLYFILGGTVPILDKEPEKRIRLKKLLEYISDCDKLKEIILSMNTTPDGEHTTSIVKEAIGKVIDKKLIKVSVLGKGLSTGAELEYVDKETIKNALENRH